MDYFLAFAIPFLLATIILRIFDYNETLNKETLKIKAEKDVNKRR